MLDEPILIDTGPLIALYSERDSAHIRCLGLVAELPVGKAYTCWPVIVEAAYLLRGYPRDRKRLFDALAADEFVLLPLRRDDIAGIQHVLDRFADQQIDLADAALVHLAHRESISAVFTLDVRHFSILRRADNQPFRIFPE